VTALSWTASPARLPNSSLTCVNTGSLSDVCEPTGSPVFFSPFQIPKDQQRVSKFQDLLPQAVRNTETLRLERAMTAGSQAEALHDVGAQAIWKLQSSATRWSPDGPPSAL